MSRAAQAVTATAYGLAAVAAAGCIALWPHATPDPEPTPAVTALTPGGVLATPEPTPDRIEEDEPGWDCHTMGNQVCGEDLTVDVDVPELTAPEPVRKAAPAPEVDPREPTTTVGEDWDGLLIGDVIVCPPGLEVSIDVTPAGQEWAACM